MYKMLMNSLAVLRRRRVGKEFDAIQDESPVPILPEVKHSIFYDYILNPFYLGIEGFAGFLFLIILIEIFAYVITNSDSLSIGLNDVMIAVVGFIFRFAYELFKQFENN